jgi:hypothetical protein
LAVDSILLKRKKYANLVLPNDGIHHKKKKKNLGLKLIKGR